MSSNQEVFNERINRIITASNHIEPDRVPIMSCFDTWAISYAGSTIRKCLENPDKALHEVYSKPYREIYSDVTAQRILNRNMNFYEILGSNIYMISEDGTTIQHNQGVTMDELDYPELIKNPEKYFLTKLFPKKFPGLTIEKIVEAAKQVLARKQENINYSNYFRDELAMPILADYNSTYAYPPLDFLFDFLRGFKGTTIDIRRRPDQVLEAIDALFPVVEIMLGGIREDSKLEPWPVVATMMHIPTYISHDLFLKFFAPSYEKLIYKAHAAGQKIWMYFEGSWKTHYEWLNNLPRNFVIGSFEHDDILEAKKMVGDNIMIAGGMPIEMLKYQNQQKCIDYTKKVFDVCAPGGGFMFTTDKILLTGSDVNSDILKSTYEFAHEYGKYK